MSHCLSDQDVEIKKHLINNAVIVTQLQISIKLTRSGL